MSLKFCDIPLILCGLYSKEGLFSEEDKSCSRTVFVHGLDPWLLYLDSWVTDQKNLGEAFYALGSKTRWIRILRMCTSSLLIPDFLTRKECNFCP